MHILCGGIALVLLLPRPGFAQVVSATDAMRKIKTSTNMATVPTSASASIRAARNDFEAFQIVIQGPANNVTATATSLTGPGTPLTAAGGCVNGEGVDGQIRLYQEAIINITAATPSPTGGIGGYPDALIPNVDEFDLQCRNAFGFNVPSGQNRVIWYEVYVPSTQVAGIYTGTVTVSWTGGSKNIPVQLEVWDFPLPAQPSLRSFFALAYSELPAQHGTGPFGPTLTALRKKYSVMALDHRISTPNFDDGQAYTDIGDGGLYDQAMGPLIDGTAATHMPGALMTSMNLMDNFNADTAKAWAIHFSNDHDWFSRLFMYAADEPGSNAPHRTPWNQIAPHCDAAHSANDPTCPTCGDNFKTLVASTFDRV
ncbi:MAG TPA: hypothetical protein VGI83_07340, partial [Gemmatimonadales bacterium]